MQTTHCTMHTVKCSLYTAYYTYLVLFTSRCTLHTAHYILLKARCTLHTAHYALFTAQHGYFWPVTSGLKVRIASSLNPSRNTAQISLHSTGQISLHSAELHYALCTVLHSLAYIAVHCILQRSEDPLELVRELALLLLLLRMRFLLWMWLLLLISVYF